MNNKKTRQYFGSEIGQGGVSAFMTSSYPKSFTHNIYIKSVLQEPEEMVTAIDIMANCSEDDDIIFHVSSDGGSLDSLDSLLFAMARCPAHKHAICSGTVASAATFIPFNCDTWEISPYTIFLFHSATFGSWGKQHDVVMEASFINERCERFMREQYHHFFSDSEIDEIMKHKKEWWMDAREFESRMETRNNLTNDDIVQQEIQDAADIEDLFKVPDETILNKLTKSQLVKYIKGEIDVNPDTGEITEVEDEL